MYKSTVLLALLLLLTAGGAFGQQLTTLYDINQGNIPENTQVRVEGIVVTAVAAYGFYAQEQAGGAYGGMWIYTSSETPPLTLIGDVVDVEGLYFEYYGYSEIDASPVNNGVVDIVGNGVFPAPELVRAWQVKTANPDEAEKWEAVLCVLDNLTALDLDPGYGEWFAEEFDFAVNDTLRLDDQFDYAQPDPSTMLASVTGVLRYSFDDFKLNPRSNDDIVYTGADPAVNIDWAVVNGAMTIDIKFDRNVEEVSAQTISNYFLNTGANILTATRDAVELDIVHLTCDAPTPAELYVTLTVFNVENEDGVPMAPQDTYFWGGINRLEFAQTPDAGGDSSMVAGQVITIEGIVHSKYDVNSNHVYLQEVSSPGLFNGMEVYLTSLLADVEVGDHLIIGDFLSEYFNMTSLTEPFLYFEKVSSGNPVTAPEEITIDGGDLEPYEGALVATNEVTVVERGGYSNFYTWSVTQDELNWLKVGDMGTYTYIEGLGDTLNLRGTLRYLFEAFHMQPRDDDDIDILYQNPIAAPDLPAGATVLGQNYPNPFNPSTKIAFQLGTAGAVDLAVYDLEGRLVRTLHSGQLATGQHEMVWDGQTEAGHPAASGLYLYRLDTAQGQQMRKMLMLK